MRSAVSSILSEPSDQSPMAFPDYEQTVWDQRSILVLVNSIGPRLNEDKFDEIFEQISAVNEVCAEISTNGDATTIASQELGNKRTFLIRYVKNYPVENNEWGDFQKHRQVQGIISVGGYTSVQELEEIKRLHQLSKSKYAGSVVDSRLIVLGLHEDQQEPISRVEHLSQNTSDTDAIDQSDNNVNGESRTLFYQDHTFQQDVPLSQGDENGLKPRHVWKDDIIDFITGIFWILESKRREETQRESRQERMNLLCTPFEKKDFVGLDLDSRANKKRIYGRYQKYLGDLNLICDRILEAYEHYQLAADALRSCNDWIWLAGAMEGLCAISVMLHYPSSRKSINPLTPDPASIINIDILKPRDIVERYKEIVVHYSKYRLAGVIETEASIKAVQVLIEQHNFVLAAEFLQNLVFINLNMNDEEKIHRFSALANLYYRIGFYRKAAFFLRVSAMRCVAPQNPHPDWKMCHSLLMRATPGYSLELSKATKGSDLTKGWPALQIQLIQEMVGTARRMGHFEIAVSHMVHLLEGMFQFLSKSELTDICRQLEVLVSRSKDTSPLPITTEFRSGDNQRNEIDSKSLGRIPNVTAFNLCPLPSHLIPRTNLVAKNSTESVFVFTPKQFGGEKSKKGAKAPFCWVENDVAEVSLMLSNPLPIEIKIVNLVLMHQGTLAFEAFPTTFALRSSKEPISVNLLGVPKEAGELTITGYECTVLGIPSKVHLQTISKKFPSEGFTVQIVKALPQVQVSLHRIKSEKYILHEFGDTKEEYSDGFSSLSSNVSEKVPEVEPDQGGPILIFYGEEARFELTLTNISSIKAHILNVTWNSNCQLNDSACTIDDPTNITLDSKETKKIGFSIIGMPTTKSLSRKKGTSSTKQYLHDSSGMSFVDNNYEQLQPGDDVELQFKITYSVGSDHSTHNNYYREVTKPFNMTIMPSAMVTKWDVLPSESSDKNFLVLDIINCSQNEMDLVYAESKKLVIEPSDVCRIPLPIDRFALPETEKNSEEIQKRCVDIIKKQINVQWTIPLNGENKYGKVLLDNIHLSDKMIENLELLPTSWKVYINDINVENLPDDASFPVGKAIRIRVNLESAFEHPFKGQICVEFYVHGSKNSVPDTCVITQKESRLQVCNPGSIIEHSTMILPLIQGKFEVECVCKIEQRTSKISGDIFSNVTKYPPITVVVK